MKSAADLTILESGGGQLAPAILNQPSSTHTIPTNLLGIIKELPSPLPSSVSNLPGIVGRDNQVILIKALFWALVTQRVLARMHSENEAMLRMTAIMVAWEAGIESTEDENGVLGCPDLKNQ